MQLPVDSFSIRRIKEQEDSRFRSLEKRFDTMQSMVEKLVLTVTRTADQERQTELIKSMYNSGWLKTSSNDLDTQ